VHGKMIRALVGYCWGLILFFAVGYSCKYGLQYLGIKSPVESQIVFKSGLVLVALVVWKLFSKPMGEMGWRSASFHSSHLVWFALGAISMMAGTVVMIFLNLRHPLAEQMTFPQLVLVVWLLSSFSEEIYVRGLVQSWVADHEEATGLRLAGSPSVVFSALLFASLHVPLIWTDAGVKGGLTLVLATLGLGWGCAALRAQSRSLWPAIACHILGNVAALPGGVLGILLYRLAYGELPPFIKPS
jgi:membrane protease YdiL (CAAX protease family)